MKDKPARVAIPGKATIKLETSIKTINALFDKKLFFLFIISMIVTKSNDIKGYSKWETKMSFIFMSMH